METQVANQVELTPTEDSVYKMILRRVSDEFHAMDDVKCKLDQSNPNVRSFIVEIMDSNFAVYGILDSVQNDKGVSVKESNFGCHRVFIDVSRDDIEADDIATNVVESIFDLMQKHEEESDSAEVESESAADAPETTAEVETAAAVETESTVEVEDNAVVEATEPEPTAAPIQPPAQPSKSKSSGKSSGRGAPRPILLDDKLYESALDAHRKTGLNKSTIWSWLQKDPAKSRARYAD